MTTSIYRISAVALVATTVFTSCAKLPKQSKYIPAEATVVMDINTRQLSNKLVSGGLDLNHLLDATAQTSNVATGKQPQDSSHEGPAAKALKNAQNSGVDLTNHFFAAFVQDTLDLSKSYVSMVVALTDSSKFSGFIKSAVPDAVAGQGDDFAYVFLPQQQTIIGWNADNAVSITGLNPMAFQDMARGMMGNTPAAYPPMSDSSADHAGSDSTMAAVPPTPASGPSDDSLRHFWTGRLSHLFHLKDKERATDLASFKTLLKQNADISFWSNTGSLTKNQALQQIPGNIRKLVEDSYGSATINFEDGKVVLASESYVSPTLDSILRKYKTTIDEDMLKNYPSKDVNMYLALGFDPHALGDLLSALQLYEVADAGLQKMAQVSLADVLNALSGQIVTIGSDYAQVKKPSPWDPADSSMQTDMKWVFSAKVKDKAAFQRLMESPLASTVLTKEGDRYVPVVESSKFFATDITTDHITAGSSAQLVAQYSAGKSGAVSDDQLKLAKGQNAAYYTDFSRLLKELQKQDLKDSSINAAVKEAAGLFKEFTYQASPLENKVVKSEAVLALQDGSKNALPQLVSFALDMTKLYQASMNRDAARYAQYANQYATDSTVAEPKTDTVDYTPGAKKH